MRVTFGYSADGEKGTVISFFGLPTPSQPGHADGFAVVLADKLQFVRGGAYTRFVVVPLDQLKTDPPDRKWGLS